MGEGIERDETKRCIEKRGRNAEMGKGEEKTEGSGRYTEKKNIVVEKAGGTQT